jgi:hypothetical protein
LITLSRRYQALGAHVRRERERAGPTSRAACDPDGAGKYIADLVRQMGGTSWPGVSTQYYQSGGSGRQFIANDPDFLAGVWADDSNPISGLAATSSTAAAGPGNTYYDLAAEAQRAIAHFGITDLADANIIIAQPPITDPGAEDVVSTGLTGTQTYEGGRYDAADANENGDKCAWAAQNLLTAQGPPDRSALTRNEGRPARWGTAT